jgi:uncharacterized protein with HEPN domain
MVKRDLRLFLQDILDSIELIREYVHGMDAHDFEEDMLVQDAVDRRLEIIAEASKHIPGEMKVGKDGIPWRSITAMRNIMVHEYFGVQRIFVWKTITEELNDLEVAVKAMLEELPPHTR